MVNLAYFLLKNETNFKAMCKRITAECVYVWRHYIQCTYPSFYHNFCTVQTKKESCLWCTQDIYHYVYLHLYQDYSWTLCVCVCVCMIAAMLIQQFHNALFLSNHKWKHKPILKQSLGCSRTSAVLISSHIYIASFQHSIFISLG